MNKHGKLEKPKQLNLKDAETYELAAELAHLRGDTLSGAVKLALRETLQREQRIRTKPERLKRLMELAEWYSSLPDKDTRSADEILGYDENGLPT
jgi:antitoxin VapB